MINEEIIKDLIEDISKYIGKVELDVVCLIYLIGIKKRVNFYLPECIANGKNIIRFNREIESMFKREFSLEEIYLLYKGKQIKIPSTNKYEKHILLQFEADNNILKVRHKYRISGLLKSYLTTIFK